MPQLGETVAEGTITQWFKAVGEKVEPGENLFEIETDKATMEVPATSAGRLAEIRVPKGGVVPVGAIVAVIADGSGTASVSSAAASAPPARAPSTAPTTPSPTTAAARPIKLDPFREVRTPERNFGPERLAGGIVVMPLARRLAGEAGLDLARVTGSGPHGRIVARDVEQATSAKARPASEPGAEQ